jgi:hypothetical protein
MILRGIEETPPVRPIRAPESGPRSLRDDPPLRGDQKEEEIEGCTEAKCERFLTLPD